MPPTPEPSPATRLAALLDHLEIGAAHFGAPMPHDLAGLAAAQPQRIAGLVLCVPSRLDPAPFVGLAERMLMIAGERGPAADTTASALPQLPGTERVVLAGYDAPGAWADVVADRADAIVAAMRAFLGGRDADAPGAPAAAGTHAGITWRLDGSGPALILLPFFLAPSQWEPAIPRLAEEFSVVTLGGPHLGGVAALEDRARMPSYRALLYNMIEAMAPRPGERILEIGSGAGSLVRLAARRLGKANPIVAADLNPFLLREAVALTEAEGLAGRIDYRLGNAEALPFADGEFDCAYSITVFEECDARRAIAEAMRVLRPGGRLGLAVRALDMPQWWPLDLPDALSRKVAAPPHSVGPAGIADKRLYAALREAGFVNLVCFPALVTLDRPGGPIWQNREDAVLSILSPQERPVWLAERDKAAAEGLLFMAHPLHCAVARKPG